MHSEWTAGWSPSRQRVATGSGRAVWLRTPDWDDLDALARWIWVLAAAAEVEANLWPLSEEEALQWAGAQLSRWFAGGGFLCLADVEGSVVGEVEVIRRPAYQSHVGLLSLGVLPGNRGDGVGRRLLAEAIARAPEGGIGLLQLSVFTCNAPALHLYRSLGFREAGRLPGAVRDGEACWDEIIMVRTLAGGGRPRPD